MKKIALLCSLGLIMAGTSVGIASNAAKTEKQLNFEKMDTIVLAYDVKSVEFATMQAPEAIVFVLVDIQSFEYEKSLTSGKIDFVKPDVLFINDLLPGELKPYKQKGQLKAKYHPDHLFNPVKLC